MADPAEALLPSIERTWSCDPPRLTIWDSLFLGAARPVSHSNAKQVLLLHFLPSLNPMLSSSARIEARGVEERWIDQVDAVITTGKSLENYMTRTYPAARLHRCEPGVDDVFWQVRRWKHQVPGGALRLLSIGNLTAAKGFGDILDALGGLSSANWRWHIAGSDRLDPSFANRFLQRATPLLRQGRIVYHGVLSEIGLAGLMANVDLFVSASHYESYGMALAEAVAAGLAVVTTDVGDAVDIASNAAAAWLIPPGDSTALPAALSDAMAALESNRIDARTSECRSFGTWPEAFLRFRSICETLIGLAGAP